MRISDWSSDVCSSDLESQPPVESRLSHRRIQAQMTTHYRQLTQGQRYQIEAGLSAAESQASIAKRVGVHPSTISREVRRNSRSEEHTSELQSLMRISYAVFCLKKKTINTKRRK